MPFINAIASYSQLVGKYAGGLYVTKYVIATCQSVITLSVTLTGDIRGHTFLWEQLSGTPVTFDTPVDQPSVVFQQTTIADDKQFVFWIDKGLPYAIQIPVLVSSKPTDVAQIGSGSGPTLFPVNLFDYSDHIVTLYGASPHIATPNGIGMAYSNTLGYSSWDISFQPPLNRDNLSTFTVNSTQAASGGYQSVATNIPYVNNDAAGLTFQYVPSGSAVRIDANYLQPGGFRSSTPPIQILSLPQAVAGDLIGAISFGPSSSPIAVAATFADYRITGQSASDTISQTSFGNAALSGAYTTTTVSTGINTGSFTTIESPTASYVAGDYRLQTYPTVPETIQQLSFGPGAVPPLTYVVTGAGIISLG